MRKSTIQLKDITLYDLLTVNTHSDNISIRSDLENGSYNLIPSGQTFYGPNGLFANPEEDGIVLCENNNKRNCNLDRLLEKWDSDQGSCVVLIEGFAGCGKSTLVQYILVKQLKKFEYEYNFYDYDLETQNDILIRDETGEIIKKSSIFEAIKKCFIEQFMLIIKINKNIFRDFMKLLEYCKEFPQFSSLYYDFYCTQTFDNICVNVNESIEKNERIISINLWKQINTISSSECILALDYLFRLTMYKNRMMDKLYVCYDNLDAIEDAEDLKSFDDKLAKFSWNLDKFIIFIERKKFFINLTTPHFVIFATYRKITAAYADIANVEYKEVITDRLAGENVNKYIYHIDATSAFSYSKIVLKRKQYFDTYLKTVSSINKETNAMTELSSWNKLNQNLEIMGNRYASLWNKNFRTCSLIANELFKEEKYRFNEYVNYIEKMNIKDGHISLEDEDGDKLSFSFCGGSAVILNAVCKVFNSHHIWDQFLHLTPLIPNAPFNQQVSFSRLILTYLYNKMTPVSLKELYEFFCKKKLFSYKNLCRNLSNMLARNKEGVWRRPIYYYNECLPFTEAKDIQRELLAECQQMEEGKEGAHNYEFVLCDSGKTYVEQLMQEFEFFSNRLSNKNMPLYFYKNTQDISSIINNVYLSVKRCCENMEQFRKTYIKLSGISDEKYLTLLIHPTTNIRHSPQLHTERIIFSHIGYINSVRLYFVDRSITSNLARRKDFNTMFVTHIKHYLDLYVTYIHPISTKRDSVAKRLNDITEDIIKNINQNTDNESILFQSISLKGYKQ